MAHTFLSDAWFDAVEELRGDAPAPPEAVADVAVNMVVTGGPDGDREMHFAKGQFDRGAVEGAPTTVSLPYDVARAMLVDGNPQAAMQAFMAGQIKVEGDMTRLMSLQSSAGSMMPSGEQLAFLQQLRDITA